MGILEFIVLGLALSADAASVTAANVLGNPRLSLPKRWAMPIAFGVFQGLMPLIGFFAGSFAAEFIESFAGVVTLIILGAIGGKMIWDAFHEDDEIEDHEVSYKAIFVQAIATSIDAFAVGVAFAAEGSNIFLAAPIIALCTFACCVVVLQIGTRLGSHFGKNAQIIGGIILIAIGIKALF